MGSAVAGGGLSSDAVGALMQVFRTTVLFAPDPNVTENEVGSSLIKAVWSDPAKMVLMALVALEATILAEVWLLSAAVDFCIPEKTLYPAAEIAIDTADASKSSIRVNPLVEASETPFFIGTPKQRLQHTQTETQGRQHLGSAHNL